MKDDKMIFVSNNVKNAIIWSASCALIAYAIKQTGRLAPLLALMLVPVTTISTKIDPNGEVECKTIPRFKTIKGGVDNGSSNGEES